MGQRVYMTDAAQRLIAARDAELNPDPTEAIEGILQRMDDLESALAVLIERGDTDGPAGTTCCEHNADNDVRKSGLDSPDSVEHAR